MLRGGGGGGNGGGGGAGERDENAFTADTPSPHIPINPLFLPSGSKRRIVVPEDEAIEQPVRAIDRFKGGHVAGATISSFLNMPSAQQRAPASRSPAVASFIPLTHPADQARVGPGGFRRALTGAGP